MGTLTSSSSPRPMLLLPLLVALSSGSGLGLWLPLAHLSWCPALTSAAALLLLSSRSSARLQSAPLHALDVGRHCCRCPQPPLHSSSRHLSQCLTSAGIVDGFVGLQEVSRALPFPFLGERGARQPLTAPAARQRPRLFTDSYRWRVISRLDAPVNVLGVLFERLLKPTL